MAYSNAIFYLDYEGGSDTARTALTTVTVSNPSGTITRANKTAHGLVTGAVVYLTLFSSWLNDSWKITVVDANNFDLDGAVWQTTADNNGTATPKGGSSKADAAKLFANVAVQAGDTVRVMGSPDPTLIGSATWTQYSKTITLASAVTANISDCETAWTGSTNVTVTADATNSKENTKSMKAVIATAFTTGKAAYFATGSLNLSGYQQVSFMLFNSAAITASTLSLRLCTDTTGDVSVHTIPLPALPSNSNWIPVVVNLGTNMNSAIQSIALYQDVDIAAVTITIDNVIACKAASSADSLTHQSLIGKATALSWVASTAYSVGDSRKPTPPNRNGFRYVVTVAGTTGSTEPIWPQEYGVTVTDGSVTWSCVDLEESWHALISINGTTLTLDNGNPSAGGNTGRGYDGATETIATYKRDTIKGPMVTGTVTVMNNFTVGGTSAAPINYSGGWDRTSMSVQSGESWFDCINSQGYFFQLAGISNVIFDNMNLVRHYFGYIIPTTGGYGVVLKNIHCNYGQASMNLQGVTVLSTIKVIGFQANACSGVSGGSAYNTVSVRAYKVANAGYGLAITNSNNYAPSIEGSYVVIKNCSQYAILGSGTLKIRNLITANNALGAVSMNFFSSVVLYNALMSEATPFPAWNTSLDRYIYSHNHQQIANNHYLQTDGGTIISATDQRHSASGISWKFRPTSTNRGSGYPLKLSVAKIACTANTTVNVTIWTRRDNTNIAGTLKILGGQIAGVGADVSVSCTPTINTWVQSSALTFTPTEAGVVEIMFECYDGVGTSNNFWVDDLTVS